VRSTLVETLLKTRAATLAKRFDRIKSLAANLKNELPRDDCNSLFTFTRLARACSRRRPPQKPPGRFKSVRRLDDVAAPCTLDADH